MTQGERDRLVVLKKAQRKLITQRQAAAERQLSERQVRMLVRLKVTMVFLPCVKQPEGVERGTLDVLQLRQLRPRRYSTNAGRIAVAAGMRPHLLAGRLIAGGSPRRWRAVPRVGDTVAK